MICTANLHRAVPVTGDTQFVNNVSAFEREDAAYPVCLPGLEDAVTPSMRVELPVHMEVRRWKVEDHVLAP